MALVPCKLWSMFLLIIVLSACAPPKNAEQLRAESYNQGYAQGKVDGDKEGHARGYDEGFKQVYPGSKHQHSGFLGFLQKTFAILGALVIPIALVSLVVYLLGESKSSEQIAGKVLMGVLGSIVFIWLTMAFGISDTIKARFLSPSSETVAGWLFVGSLTASSTFTAFFLADKYLQLLRGPMLQGWCVFIASALLTVFVPALLSVFIDAPDINNYFASELLVGVLMGGVYYLARDLLLSKPEKAE